MGIEFDLIKKRLHHPGWSLLVKFRQLSPDDQMPFLNQAIERFTITEDIKALYLEAPWELRKKMIEVLAAAFAEKDRRDKTTYSF